MAGHQEGSYVGPWSKAGRVAVWYTVFPVAEGPTQDVTEISAANAIEARVASTVPLVPCA